LTEDALGSRCWPRRREFSVLRSHRRRPRADHESARRREYCPSATSTTTIYANLSAAEEAAKDAYRDFLQKVPARRLQICRIDLIMSGNFAYFAERELHGRGKSRRALRHPAQGEISRVPGGVSYYEIITPPPRPVQRTTRIIVYNAYRARRSRSRRVVVPPEPYQQSAACRGSTARMPAAWCGRAKRCRKRPGDPVLSPCGVKTGLPALRRKGAGGDYLESLPEVRQPQLGANGAANHGSGRALCQRESQRPVMCETSKQAAGHADIFRQCAGGAVAPNIQLVEGGDPLLLLQDAWVVLGMNSTALLEALAMGKTRAVAGLCRGGDPAMLPWIADFGPAVEKMQSPDHLVARLSELTRAVRHPWLRQNLSRPQAKPWKNGPAILTARRASVFMSVIENEVAASFGSARRSAA
jgi:hypothetical protein